MNRRSPGLGLGARRFRAERLLTRTRWSPAESLCHLGIRSLPLCESGCDTCVAVQPFSLVWLPPAQYPSLQEPALAPVGTGRRSARYGEKRSMEASSPRVVFVSNGPPVPVRGLSRCREPSPVLRGHVDVVRALAPALRTDRLNPVHMLFSRRDVRETWPPCSVCSPRTPAARPHLERGVAGVSGSRLSSRRPGPPISTRCARPSTPSPSGWSERLPRPFISACFFLLSATGPAR